jgi:hypothetical protein
MSVPKLQVTKNYRLFARSIDNRPLDPKKHKKLALSFQKNGFLPCFPLGCVRDKTKSLVILDGQHRLAFAESLGLPVYFVVLDKPFDIAEVNGTQEKWNLRNFADTFIAQGKPAYRIGLDLAERFGLPLSVAFAMLAGTTSFTNCDDDYYGGTFKVKDLPWAEQVGSLYSEIINRGPATKGSVLISSCMATCRVSGFDAKRMIQGCERCREKLVAYANREAMLTMLEEVYNFGRKTLFALKNEAIMVMRERNAVNKSVQEKKAKINKSAA